MIFYTIGVYNSTEEDFFRKLVDNGIDTFCDIRQRRGVRGTKYKFVNSLKLQEQLNTLNIKYLYIKQLAPTLEIRNIQKKIDKNLFEKKYNRSKLGGDFIKNYKEIIIANYNLDLFIDSLKSHEAKKIVLFCVEENPNTCHRSIVGEEINKKGYEVKNL